MATSKISQIPKCEDVEVVAMNYAEAPSNYSKRCGNVVSILFRQSKASGNVPAKITDSNLCPKTPVRCNCRNVANGADISADISTNGEIAVYADSGIVYDLSATYIV